MLTDFFTLIPGQLDLATLKEVIYFRKKCLLADNSLPAIEASNQTVNDVI